MCVTCKGYKIGKRTFSNFLKNGGELPVWLVHQEVAKSQGVKNLILVILYSLTKPRVPLFHVKLYFLSDFSFRGYLSIGSSRFRSLGNFFYLWWKILFNIFLYIWKDSKKSDYTFMKTVILNSNSWQYQNQNNLDSGKKHPQLTDDDWLYARCVTNR